MRFARGAIAARAALCAALIALATGAHADLYLGRMELFAGAGGGWTFPVAGAGPIIGTAPGGNAVGAPLVMAERDVFVENMFKIVYDYGDPWLWTTTHASWGNGAGTLAAEGGPGTTTFCGGGCMGTPSVNAGPRPGWVRVSVPAGRLRFGGVQRVLGVFDLTAVASSPPGALSLYANAELSAVGGPVGATAVRNTKARHWPDIWTTPLTVTVTGMPWTTGKVIVEATPSGPVVTTMTGYDSTVSGFRNIQLISGTLRRVHMSVGSSTWSWNSPDIMIMHLRFVPEPGTTALAAAGLALLPLIHRVRRRKR